jgi:tetratricopeptide (TPR) repeat protein
MLAPLFLALSAFDVCEKEFEESRNPSEAYTCFYFTAQTTKSWEEAELRVNRLIERLPERRPWLELVRGHIQLERDERAAEASYRASAQGFARDGAAEGEILARNNLTRILQRQRRHPEAEAEIDKVLEVAEGSGDPVLIARARISEADYLTANGREVARAYRALKRAEKLAFPDGPDRLKRRCLEALGQVAFVMGRLDEAITVYQRLLSLLREQNDPVVAAMVAYNIADARYRKLEHLPDPRDRDEVLELAEEALNLAASSENRRAEAYARQLLVELLPRTAESAGIIRSHAERCIAVSTELRHPDRIASCLWAYADFLAGIDREEAESVMADAVRLALASDSNWYIASALRNRARLSWKTKDYEGAVADGQAALDAVESLRRLQDEEGGRIELFSDWTQDYYTFSGRAIEASDLGRAFSVMERMRARALLDSVTASSTLPGLPENPARAQALAEIASVQRRLLDPELPPEERTLALDRLARLELDETELRAKQVVPHIEEPDFASLEEIQEGLSTNQAVAAFQIGLWENVHGEFGGGAWLLLLTRERAEVFRLPDRVALEPKMPVFLGLVARGDGAEALAAGRLYDDLLRAALETLPPEVNELVVIPDGPLQHLPFSALRSQTGALGEKYALTVVPSATLWLRWRETPPAAAPVPVLAMADPELRTRTTSEERNLDFREGVALGALPHARREGRSVVRRLGGGSELLLAADASEHAIKERDLTRYGILHFAAHAVADEENPDRSAVVLSPGAESEDGLLQVREIGELGLDGRIVVLSACRTASGRTLNGEGVLSLARAFFQAGAHAVVASRWPLRDDEAAVMFDGFYRALGKGDSLARSLRAATEEAVEAGLPVSAWSGLTVYGDGSLAPVTPAPPGRLVPILLGVVLLLAVIVLARAVGRHEGG